MAMTNEGYLKLVIKQNQDLIETLEQMNIDLKILKGNLLQIEKRDQSAEGYHIVVSRWIERNEMAIERTKNQ